MHVPSVWIKNGPQNKQTSSSGEWSWDQISGERKSHFSGGQKLHFSGDQKFQ